MGSTPLTASAAEWDALLVDIRARYPNVSQVPTHSPLLEDPATLRIDVREPEEYAVSHLEGAQNARDVATIEALIERVAPRSVVLYCSVGYRSSSLADELRGRVDVPVHNLEGSLFAWANEGRSMSDFSAQPARRVHPYDTRWGRFLEPAYRAEL